MLNKKISLCFVPLFTIAFLSDILYGIVARKMSVSTDSLRRFDNLAYFILYTCVIISLCLCHRELFAGFEMALLITFIFLILRQRFIVFENVKVKYSLKHVVYQVFNGAL